MSEPFLGMSIFVLTFAINVAILLGGVARGIERLVAEGFVTRFADWSPATGLAAPPRVLREADRCAAIVLERLLPA